MVLRRSLASESRAALGRRARAYRAASALADLSFNGGRTGRSVARALLPTLSFLYDTIVVRDSE
jgi:hypothetical protein